MHVSESKDIDASKSWCYYSDIDRNTCFCVKNVMVSESNMDKTTEKTKHITRDDVARLAKVSPAVVSYVMNESKFVSAEKVAAVKRAIEELHYRPNMQARGLKTNRSMQIAFVCDNFMNYWLEDAERELLKNGYYVSHCGSLVEEGLIEMLIERRFDAVFMMSNRYSTAELNRLVTAGIPLVLYKTRDYGELDERIVTVVPDYRDATVKSVHYLVMRGHTRIALIPPVRYKVSGSGGFRLSAYTQALRQNGIEPRMDFVCTDTESNEAIRTCIMNMLLGNDATQRPTAFVAGNDYLALQVMRCAHNLGLRIPRDVAVVGADNTYLGEAVIPALTSIDFSKTDFCKCLVNALFAVMRGERPEDTYIPVSLCVRETT